jgi:glyoxylase-like metal-dependent hydrolase (beta-lactamase superfamily II)
MKLLESETVVPHLHASAPERLPFGRDLVIRSFLLERPAGNLLVYSTRNASGDVWRQYLNHGHEAAFAPHALHAPVFVHAADRAAVEGAGVHVRGSFSQRHTFEDDFEVIPTPGHTPGATAYLWDTGDHRLLFTGDTIYLDGEEWVPALLPSSDRDAYVASLELIAQLDFDVLVPWAASRGGPYLAPTDPSETRRRIARIIERLPGAPPTGRRPAPQAAA